MKEDVKNPKINSAKIPVGGGIAGAFCALASMVIFLIGVPMLRYLFPAAVVLGCGVALVLHFVRHKTTGAPWILSGTKEIGTAPPVVGVAPPCKDHPCSNGPTTTHRGLLTEQMYSAV